MHYVPATRNTPPAWPVPAGSTGPCWEELWGWGALGSAPTPGASRNPAVWDQVGRKCQKQPHQERGLERFLFLMLRSLLCSYKILQDFVVSVRSPSTLCLRKQ